jgi:hypothetical protein
MLERWIAQMLMGEMGLVGLVAQVALMLLCSLREEPSWLNTAQLPNNTVV